MLLVSGPLQTPSTDRELLDTVVLPSYLHLVFKRVT